MSDPATHPKKARKVIVKRKERILIKNGHFWKIEIKHFSPSLGY
jgi:hypothetical protein